MINLDNILNGYNCFVEDGLGFMEYSLGRVDEDFVNEYGYGKKMTSEIIYYSSPDLIL